MYLKTFYEFENISLISELRRQEQDLAIGGERLNSLHAKLHQEADKIRKWKNQTELDLKQKVGFLPFHSCE